MSSKQVDVLINVFAKPWQTAFSLLTLLRHSSKHIDKIYFHEERAISDFERRNHKDILDYLSEKIIHFTLPHWLSSNAVEEEKLKDEEYRLSMRYQYGLEKSDKKYALLIHNDIEVLDDIVGQFLLHIDEATAIGQLGQCWWCPAGQMNICTSERYMEFKPKYHQLMYIYNKDMDYNNRRAYNLGLKQEFWEQPWPLPECRVNEWCMLINLQKARPDSMPQGSARPLGGQFASGSKIGEDWEHVVNLDTGVQWFRDMHKFGHSFKHFNIDNYIIHDRKGKLALSSAETYVHNETVAKIKIQKMFPDFFNQLA